MTTEADYQYMRVKPFVVTRINRDATLRQISDAFITFGLSPVVRVKPIDPFLKDAWIRKARNERFGK